MVEVLLPMTKPDRSSLPAPMPPSVSLKTQQEIKSAVHQELIKRMDLERLPFIEENPAAKRQLMHLIQQLIGEQGIPLSAAERDRLAKELMDEVFGLGPLEPLLQDPTVSDILVNTCNTVYVDGAAFWKKPTSYSKTIPT